MSVRPEDLVEASDGGDMALAINRAIRGSAPKAKPGSPQLDPAKTPIGGKVLLSATTYECKSSVIVDRTVILEGEGGSGWYASSVLHFAPGVPGIVLKAAWSVLTDFAVVGTWPPALIPGSNPPAVKIIHGIECHARAVLQRLWVDRFPGCGVFWNGDTTQGFNVNGWRSESLRIDECGTGHYVHGGDSNAGIGTAIDVGGCSGVDLQDASFIGNLYLGGQVADVGGVSASQDGNGYNFFMNTYAESGAKVAVNHPSVWLGGPTPPQMGPKAPLQIRNGMIFPVRWGIRLGDPSNNGAGMLIQAGPLPPAKGTKGYSPGDKWLGTDPKGPFGWTCQNDLTWKPTPF